MRSLLPLLLPAALTFTACDSGGDEGGGGRNDDILALSGDAARGEMIFTTRTCSSSSCHGPDGNSGTAPDLNAEVPAESDDQIIDAVLDGAGAMPPNDLSDQEMADVLAWLRQSFGG